MAQNTPTKLHSILAWRLRAERDRLALSQAAFAERIGISTGYMAALELGHKFPSPARLESIASALDTEPYRLLMPQDEKPGLEERELAYNIGSDLRRVLENDIKDYMEKNYGRSGQS